MITSKDILKKTGIKSAKTLTRWHQRGIIPKPLIGTHPNGRGKIAYWQDWVLGRCLEIIKLQRQGHTLKGMYYMLEATTIIKKCALCSREYDIRGFLALFDLSRGCWMDINPGSGLLLKNCSCGTTISIEIIYDIVPKKG